MLLAMKTDPGNRTKRVVGVTLASISGNSYLESPSNKTQRSKYWDKTNVHFKHKVMRDSVSKILLCVRDALLRRIWKT